MKNIERQPLVFTREICKEDGREFDVLEVESGLENMDMSDNQCCLCGLKIRNGGKHSYLVHKMNGGRTGRTLLRCDIADLWDLTKAGARVSQGGSAIGAECRKKLPAEFVLKVSEWDNQ